MNDFFVQLYLKEPVSQLDVKMTLLVLNLSSLNFSFCSSDLPHISPPIVRLFPFILNRNVFPPTHLHHATFLAFPFTAFPFRITRFLSIIQSPLRILSHSWLPFPLRRHPRPSPSCLHSPPPPTPHPAPSTSIGYLSWRSLP